MEMNKFDKILWRFNGVVFALICIGGVLFGIWAIFSLCKTFNTDPVKVVASTTKPQSKKKKLQLQEFRQITGTNFLVAPLTGDSFGRAVYSSLSSSGSTGEWAPSNYLFLDERDGSSHWLSPDNKSRFMSRNELFADPNANRENLKVIAIVYEVAPSRADNAGEDDEKPRTDRKVIRYDISTGSTTTLIDGVESLLTATQISKTKALIVVKSGPKHIVLAIDPMTSKQIYKKDLTATISEQ